MTLYGRLRVIRTLFILGALHGNEASFLADSISRVVWSGKQPLASTGAVLSLLDGPQGCDPAFCVVWFRFRMLRRYLAYRPEEVRRVYRLIEGASGGCPGHGPEHLLVERAAEVGFQWNTCALGWVGLACLFSATGWTYPTFPHCCPQCLEG